MRMAAPLTRAYIEPLAVVERPPPTVVLCVSDMLAPLCGVRVVIVFFLGRRPLCALRSQLLP